MEPIVIHNNADSLLIEDQQQILDIVSEFVWEKSIRIAGWAAAHYTLVAFDNAAIKITVETQWEESDCTISVLCLSKAPHVLSVDLTTVLAHSNSTVNMHMVTLYGNWWNASINGNIVMNPWIMKLEGHLLEENIIIGEWVQIKTLPMLDVRSNDVVASHGARVEKVDPQKLFYMTSKWISKDDATALMVWWYIDQLLQGVKKESLISKWKAFCLGYILNE